jgi:hypothetical protein
MNIERFNYMIADVLKVLTDQEKWEEADMKGEEIRLEIHSLINSDLESDDLWEEKLTLKAKKILKKNEKKVD